MKVIRKVVGLLSQNRVGRRTAGVELNSTQMAMVSGGLPKTGWGSAEEAVQLSLDLPKTGW
jgi:hypothetical protein